MSALRYAFVIKLVDNCTVKQGVDTVHMINHTIEIISSNKQPNVGDGCGLSLFSLLQVRYQNHRAHRRSTEVEFMLNDSSLPFIASNNCSFKLVKLSLLHAKIYDEIMASRYGFQLQILHAKWFHSLSCYFVGPKHR